MMKILVFLLALSAQATTLLRIQCGGPGGTDPQGNVWQSDSGYYMGGAAWSAANQASMGTLPVPYSTLRYSSPVGSSFSYSIPVTTPGSYTVTFKFVEPNKTAVGQRVFNAAVSAPINGASAGQSIDLFAVAPGALRPYDVQLPIIVAPGSDAIKISFTVTTGNAVISGIQVDSGDTTTPLVYAPYLTGLEYAAPACPTGGLTFFYATDTDHLFRCYNGGDWKVVGDVRNAPPVAILRECKGSGAGWSCDGLLWATISLTGSTVQLVGTAMSDFQGVGNTWTERH